MTSGRVTSALGDGHPLLLAAGQLGRSAAGPVGQPHPRQGLAEHPGLGWPAVEAQRQRDVLLSGQRPHQVKGLEDGPHAVPAQLIKRC